jgi:hypothetical protein
MDLNSYFNNSVAKRYRKKIENLNQLQYFISKKVDDIDRKDYIDNGDYIALTSAFLTIFFKFWKDL